MFQRTPSAVDIRDQHETDPARFQDEVANQKGWQRARNLNFAAQFTVSGDHKPTTNLVNDEWTRIEAYCALIGGPGGPMRMEDIPAFIGKLHALDLARQNRVRRRAMDVVRNPEVAKKLQAFYPSWCKRPCFHDDYLATFNRENVTLVDTAGKGVEHIGDDSVVFGAKTYPVDVIIFATGFRSPSFGSPADRSNTSIVGRGGASLSEEWISAGPRTLHAVLRAGFPNLFYPGPYQNSATANQTFNLDNNAQHTAYILTTSLARASGKPCAIVPRLTRRSMSGECKSCIVQPR